MFTSLGRLLRKIRIDQGMLLKEMADGLGITSAFLSAIETGKKAIPNGFETKLIEFLGYPINSKEARELIDAAILTKGEVRLSTHGRTDKQQEVVLAFARNFERLPAPDLDRLLAIMNKARTK